jgi:hypothetical protein
MSTKLGEGEEREEMLLKLSRSTPELDLAHLIGAQINERERERRRRRRGELAFLFSGSHSGCNRGFRLQRVRKEGEGHSAILSLRWSSQQTVRSLRSGSQR